MMDTRELANVVIFVCLLVVCGSLGVAWADEEVLDRNGENVRFGVNYQFGLQAKGSNIIYYGYHFGLGWGGLPVRTDQEITWGLWADTSRVYACRNGSLVQVRTPEGGAASNTLLVLTKDEGSYYKFRFPQIENGPFYVHLDPVHCNGGESEGSPIRFINNFWSSTLNLTQTNDILAYNEHSSS